MNKLFRFTPSRLALAYIALSVLALAMLAIPLWYAWRSNVATFKAYVDGESLQRLVEVFDRKGAKGLVVAIESGTAGRANDEFVVLADASKRRLAGNLPGWPAEVPAAPGTYGLVIGGLDGGSSTRVVATHVTLPGGYHLLVGRESVRFQSLVELFWYGIAGATVIVLVLGVLAGWVIRRALLSEVQDISRTASAIAEGDFSRRVPAGGGSDELDILARTVNGMLDQLARQNVQLADEVAVRRQAEQALHSAHDELEGLVAQRTAQLAQANESLEHALREMQGQKAQLDDLFELSPDAIVLTALDKPRNLRINKEFTRMFGFTAEEALGRRLRELIAPDDLGPANLTADPDLLAGRTVEREVIRQRKDGTRFHAHITAKRVRLPDTEEDAAYIIYRDVTERKRAEEALRLSEERYARAMDATEAGHWEWDLRTNEVFHSVRFRELNGVSAEERFSHRDEWKSRQHFLPGERERQDQAIRGAISGPVHRYEIDVQVAPRPGEIRWLRSRGKLFRDEAGRPALMAGTLMDVTEQKLAQEALRQSEERFSAMFRSSPGPLALHTLPDGRFVDVNPVWLELFGFSRDQVIGRTSEELGLHEDPGVRRQVYEMLERDGYLDRVETTLRCADGWLRLCLVSARHVEIGSERLSVTGLIDVTEAKRTALTLAESESRYRSLTELSSDFFWETDAEHRYTSIEYGKAYPGYGATASKLDRKSWEIPHVSPDEAAWRAHRAAIAARERFVDFNFSRIENGEERFYEVSGEPRFDAQGNFLGYRGVGRDVTVRKRAEMTLRKSEERYARVMQASEDGFWGWIVATDEFYASPRMLALYGLPPDTVFRGRADFLSRFTFHPEDLELWRKAVAAHLAGQTARVDLEVRTERQTETRWIHLTAICQRDASGAEERWTGSVSDVTERRRAQEALRVSEARYARAMDASADGLWEWNAASDELFTSLRARELWGIPDGVEIRTRAELKAQNLQFTEDTIRECIAQRSGVEMTYSVLNQAGELRWVRSMGKVFLGEHGEPMLVTGSLTDVTERKLTADALRLSEEELRSRQEMLDLAQKSAQRGRVRVAHRRGRGRESLVARSRGDVRPCAGPYDGTSRRWKKLDPSGGLAGGQGRRSSARSEPATSPPNIAWCIPTAPCTGCRRRAGCSSTPRASRRAWSASCTT